MRNLNSILSVFAGLLGLWLITQLSHTYRFRLDLTEEQRFSVTDATKSTLAALDQSVFVEVFLEGDLPPEFIRFQTSLRETLEEFAIYGDVQFKFVNPSQAKNQEARNRFFQSLMQRGVQPTNLNYRKDGQSSQLWIFPGAVISIGSMEKVVNLLSGDRNGSKEEVINESIEGLEYEFINAISSLTQNRKRVGLVLGHGEPDSTQLAGLAGRISENYDLFNVRLQNRANQLVGYDALVLLKPTTSFNEKEKYLIDQFVISGGKLMVFYDALRVNMDSASGEGTIAIPYEINLDDLLFKYGVRVNKNYALDVYSGTTPVVTGNFGEQPQIQQLPWPFFPVINQYGDHPAVKGLDAALLRFTSTIDTVKAVGIKKTPLLMTSERTKILSPPVKVAFNDLQGSLKPEFFTDGSQVVGYLLEGKFQSLYKNRFLPKGVNKNDFVEDGVASRIVLIADGDMIRNEFDAKTNQPLDLGMDPYSGASYANGELVTRLLNYLTDDDGLVMIRSKEIKIRPLDKIKVKEEKAKWQIINVATPILLIVFFGLIKFYIRKRKFSSK